MSTEATKKELLRATDRVNYLQQQLQLARAHVLKARLADLGIDRGTRVEVLSGKEWLNALVWDVHPLPEGRVFRGADIEAQVFLGDELQPDPQPFPHEFWRLPPDARRGR